MQILVLEEISSIGINLLKQKNFTVLMKLGIDRSSQLLAVGDADAIIIKSITQVNKNFLDAAKNLKIIGRAGAGLDNIDIQECQKRNIKIVSTPTLNSDSAADFTLMQILCLSRNAYIAQEMVKNNNFNRDLLLGRQLNKLKVGIVGYGNVGRKVAKRLNSFGVEILFYDPNLKDDVFENYSQRIYALNDLLGAVDVLTIHSPLNSSTKDLINDIEFNIMKKGIIFINTSRGQVVNEDALVRAIENKIISFAALDVCVNEPPYDQNHTDYNYSNKLLNYTNIYYTPHIGASTVDAQDSISEYICGVIIEHLTKL